VRRLVRIPWLALLLACGREEQQGGAAPEAPVVPIARAQAEWELSLTLPDSTELGVGAAAESDSALYLLDSRSSALYLIPLTGESRALRRVADLRRFGQASVFEIATYRSGVAAIGVDGMLRLMADTNPDHLVGSARIAGPMQRPIAIAARSDGGWFAALSRLAGSRAAEGPIDSVIVRSIDADGSGITAYALERVGPSRPGSFLSDRVAGHGVLDTITLVGTDPPRVVRITPAGVRIDSLQDAPQRRLGRSELTGIERLRGDRRMRGMLRGARVPSTRPAVLLARVIDRATFVSAQAGERHLSLDLYCDRRYRETLLEDATIRRIFVSARGAIVIREDGDGRGRLSYYAWSRLLPRCT
jgi:hypothetical protein